MGALVGTSLWLAVAVAVTGIFHMVVVKARLLEGLAIPIDGGRTLGGKPIFGENKTWRGVVVMVFGAALLGFVQGLLGGSWAARAGVEAIDFAAIGLRAGLPEGPLASAGGYALANLVHGIGYAVGELPNSFVKRRIGITPGKTGAGLAGPIFFLLDQADSVLAALVLGALVFGYPWNVVGVGIVVLTLLHLVINVSLYLGRIRRNV